VPISNFELSNKAKRSINKVFSNNINDETDLPSTETELSDEQISSLFYQPPTVRKIYTVYFSKSTGRIHTAARRLLFQRGEDNNLCHPDHVLQSNDPKWRKTLLWYEDPDNYNYKGEFFTRKRMRRTIDPMGSQPDFEELELRTTDEISLLTDSILKESIKAKQNVLRAVCNPGVEYSLILLDLLNNINRASRSCLEFEAKRLNEPNDIGLEENHGEGKADLN
jgi:hypothetical protein